jgi:hypothetical protein
MGAKKKASSQPPLKERNIFTPVPSDLERGAYISAGQRPVGLELGIKKKPTA